MSAESDSAIKAAVAEGVKAAIADPETWDAALAAVQRKAVDGTGKFVLSGAVLVLKKFALFISFGIIVYMLGGWSALVAFLKGNSLGG